MISARFVKHTLDFKRPSGTSRGILKQKDSWFIFLTDDEKPGVIGIGECSIIKGLSEDDRPDFEQKLQEVCDQVHRVDFSKPGFNLGLTTFPSIKFGLEVAFWDLQAQGGKVFFETPFTKKEAPISINGLIWMGAPDFMLEQIEQKLKTGFTCIKMKIGAIDFEKEISILRSIRAKYDASQIALRVDANGAFSPENALEKLRQLADLDLHSIEQPIKPGQWEVMEQLCRESPLEIALDEELIGVHDRQQKMALLHTIKPPYIILKPSLHGGFQGAAEWVQLAVESGIKWWATSSLESNIGLNAIAQWTSTYDNPLPQGLGTGGLYTNNLASPLVVEDGSIGYKQAQVWDLWRIYRKHFKTIKLNGHQYSLDQEKVNQATQQFSTEANKVIAFLTKWLEEDPFHEIKTSGSTGTPKVIRLRKHAMVASALRTGQFFDLQTDQRALLALPLDYIAGQMMVIRSLVLGLELITIPVSSNPLVHLKENVSFAALTPMQVELGFRYLQRINKLIIGGAPVSSKLAAKLQSEPTLCFETYGMTETITHVAVRAINSPHKTQTFKALPGIKLGLDQDSCLTIYALHLDLHKGLVTNDIVELVDGNCFKWLGRRDHVMNSGGVKIFPETIERKIGSVIQSPFFITSLPDTVLGEKVVLAIESIQESADISKEIYPLLEKIERPKAVYFLNQFLYTKSGKVDRLRTTKLIADLTDL